MARNFDLAPAQDLPPELYQWLLLFFAYLQIEQSYADALEWMGRSGEPSLPLVWSYTALPYISRVWAVPIQLRTVVIRDDVGRIPLKMHFALLTDTLH